jgi:hypothetical protein
MATKKPAPASTQVVVRKQTEGAMVTWQEMIKLKAQQAKAQLAKAPMEGGTTLSFKNGVTTFMGNRTENPLRIIVLAVQFERAYHDTVYSADNTKPPACYSYNNEQPHPAVKDPQSDDCEACPMNAWGSGQNNAKACKEGLRFAMITADGLDRAAKLETSQVVTAKLSVMNSKTARAFFEAMIETKGAVFANVVSLFNEPDSKTQYKTTFSLSEPLSLDDEMAGIIRAKIEQAEKMLAQPYPSFDEAPIKGPVKGSGAKKLPPPADKKGATKPAVKRSRMQ